MTRHMTLAQLLLVSTYASLASAHSRWSCPEPRSPDTGIKNGPCGDDHNDFSGGSIVEIKPGLLRVTFEESIHHTGAPWRISLSDDGSDDGSCVLLDHIPHNDCCSPRIYDPTTYTPFAITINIPNVICERCSLHLSNPMTDKIDNRGSQSGIGCTDPGTCFSVYHSCTKPFRIVGDTDAVQRSEYQCPSYKDINEDWPTVWTGDNGEDVDASTPGVYRRESSIWSTEDYTLTTAPIQYQQDAGGLCGANTGSTDTTNPIRAPTTAPVTEMTAEVFTAPPVIAISEMQTDPPTESQETTNTPSKQATSYTPPTMVNEIRSLQPSSSAAHKGLKFLNGMCIIVFAVATQMLS